MGLLETILRGNTINDILYRLVNKLDEGLPQEDLLKKISDKLSQRIIQERTIGLIRGNCTPAELADYLYTLVCPESKIN